MPSRMSEPDRRSALRDHYDSTDTSRGLERAIELAQALAAIEGLLETAQMLDDHDEQVPADLLATLFWAVEPVKRLFSADHGILLILPRLALEGPPESEHPEVTWKTVILYGPTLVNLLEHAIL